MNTLYRNTGPRRLCPVCKKQVSTTRGKFDPHPAPGSQQNCAGSQQLVPKEKFVDLSAGQEQAG